MIALIAHAATGSRGGRAALLAGIAVAVCGFMTSARRRSPEWLTLMRWAPAALALALVAATGMSLASWAAAGGQSVNAVADTVEPDLGSRIAVASQGRAVVRDFPLFGTGLGSWLHAFRPYQAPPVEGGIWDHAHDDYLELLADSGVVGTLFAVLFAIAVVGAARRDRADGSGTRALARRDARDPAGPRPPAFEISEWKAALAELPFIRWGLAGGVAAILVHSFVDFGLRMPANLLLLMTILALLVLRGRPQPTGRATGVAVLLVLVAVAVAPLLANAALKATGRHPLSPNEALDDADVKLAEEGDDGRAECLAMVRRAVDWSPADREAQVALATTLGDGPEADDALRRAIALNPWVSDVRDVLALKLFERGDRAAGAAEIEESIYRFPYLAGHSYLSAESTDFLPQSNAQIIRALADGDTMTVRLSALDDDMAAAIERGLTRALDRYEAGEQRADVVDDLVTLMEVRGRWTDAAAVLTAEAGRSTEGGTYYARAATDYLKVHDAASAEHALLAALERTPEQGDLYRDLAVRIYAARGDFDTADLVLSAGERNAVNMMPVYRATTEVLSKRESAFGTNAVLPSAPHQPLQAAEDELP